MSQEKRPVKLAVPKGSLQKTTAAFFARAGLPLEDYGENTRGNKTIASIVARPRNDCDVNAGGMAGSDRLGHGATGIFHEVDPGNARRNGAAVRLCHLGGGEQFEHWPKE